MKGTCWLISVAMKATSRESRSKASEPLPVSTSTCSVEKLYDVEPLSPILREMGSATAPAEGPMKIVLSYRRSDAPGTAGWIFERLTEHYGDESVFRDVDSIPFGV